MADTSYLITGGFFDAVDNDRLYSADQMNMPYKKLVHDGINREADGTAPGFAVTAGSGMNVIVAPGNAMIGGKWAENGAIQTIQIAGNTSGAARVDAIILQCDKSREVRAVQIVYRQGTAAAPEIVNDDYITEFRLANITVPNGAAAVSSGNITDTRGGAECPWIRSVFDAPDARYIVEEYDGTELAGSRQTVKSAIDSIRYAAQSGQPQVALQVADMSDTGKVYLYEGTETGYDAGYLYYYSDAAGAWLRGAQYGASVVDTSLDADSENPVQNKAVAAAVTELNGRLTQQASNIGDLSELDTEDKTSLVGAVNEIKQSGGGDISTLIGAELLEAENAFKEVEWSAGRFLDDGSIATAVGYKHVETFFPVRLMKYIKSLSLSIQYCAGFVFYADDKETVISTVTANTYKTGVLTIVPDIPEGAEWFRVSQYITETKSRLFTVYALEDLVKEEVSRTLSLPVDWPTAMVTSGGIAVNGSDGGYNDWQTSDYIEVFPGMNLIYTGAGNVGGNVTLCPLAFYDANKGALKVFRPKDAPYWSKWGADWIASADNGCIISSGYITVPAKAKYVRISGYHNVPPVLDVYHPNQWIGKKCAVFGDSISAGIGATSIRYSEALRLMSGIATANYAVNGSVLVNNGWDRLSACLTDHENDLPDAFIFAYGTNDFSQSKPLGDWYTTDANGTRTLTDDTTTFRGAWVRILTLLRTTYEGKKVVLMTPIHRGAGTYSSDFTRNGQGLYLEDYCEVIREAGKIFDVPVIDMYADSGLVPDINPDTVYFTPNDRLHPNTAGHMQIARTIAHALERIPI